MKVITGERVSFSPEEKELLNTVIDLFFRVEREARSDEIKNDAHDAQLAIVTFRHLWESDR